jgi:hypothetical protein
MGGITSGALLTPIERERFDVFLTGDKNMDKQQRLDDRPFAVLIMSAINWPVVKPRIHKILIAIDEGQPDAQVSCASTDETWASNPLNLPPPDWRWSAFPQ